MLVLPRDGSLPDAVVADHIHALQLGPLIDASALRLEDRLAAQQRRPRCLARRARGAGIRHLQGAHAGDVVGSAAAEFRAVVARGLGDMDAQALAPPSLSRAGPLERRAFDYGDLAAAMQAVDEAIRKARAGLARVAGTARADDDAAG
jgi:hypothetical protein